MAIPKPAAMAVWIDGLTGEFTFVKLIHPLAQCLVAVSFACEIRGELEKYKPCFSSNCNLGRVSELLRSELFFVPVRLGWCCFLEDYGQRGDDSPLRAPREPGLRGLGDNQEDRVVSPLVV